MTLDLKAVAARITELRADDAGMTRTPWHARLVDDPHESAARVEAEYDGGIDPVAYIESEPDTTNQNASGIARTRNSLVSTAGMLDALAEIAAAALAYRQARKEAARVRHTYYRTWQSSLLPSVEKHDKEEIRCRDAFEAALAKVRE